MKRFVFFVCSLVMALAAGAQQHMSFVVQGAEERYNQIRIVNRTSVADFRCRVVKLSEDNQILSVYGDYELNGYDDADSHVGWVERGEKVGVQMPNDFAVPVSVSVEYKDYPVFDIIVIYIGDTNGDNSYSDTF